MTLQRLWAGWRNAYVTGVANAEPDDGECVFCSLLAEEAPDRDSLILWRGARSVALLNLYPYATGHLLVMPTRHVAALEELSEDEGQDLWLTAVAAVAALKAAYAPDGVNLGANLGRSAGAGVPGHLHLHAVPRWAGDTNFMTSIAEVRVLPEDLPTSYDKILAVWNPPSVSS